MDLLLIILTDDGGNNNISMNPLTYTAFIARPLNYVKYVTSDVT
jgi:hypothetical protein